MDSPICGRFSPEVTMCSPAAEVNVLPYHVQLKGSNRIHLCSPWLPHAPIIPAVLPLKRTVPRVRRSILGEGAHKLQGSRVHKIGTRTIPSGPNESQKHKESTNYRLKDYQCKHNILCKQIRHLVRFEDIGQHLGLFAP